MGVPVDDEYADDHEEEQKNQPENRPVNHVPELITAIRRTNFDDVKALIDEHGQDLWKGVHHSLCQCGCTVGVEPLKVLFNVVDELLLFESKEEEAEAYTATKLEYIQRLIDENVLLMETVSDEFIIDQFCEIYGKTPNVARVRLIIRNISRDRLVNMRGKENVNPIMAVTCSSATSAQTNELVDELMAYGVDYKVKRNDGYSPFFIAVTSLDVPLVEKFRHGTDVNALIDWSVYTDGEHVSNYVNILHRLLPRFATSKRPDWLDALRRIIAILFDMGVNINAVSSYTNVSAYSLIIAYDYIDLLPITKDEFWARVGEDKRGIKYPLHHPHQYSLDPQGEHYTDNRIARRTVRVRQLYKYLHKIRFKKDQDTINDTVAHITHFCSQYTKEQREQLYNDIDSATHDLFGYMQIPEVKSLFE